jgi:hypothetical protein
MLPNENEQSIAQNQQTTPGMTAVNVLRSSYELISDELIFPGQVMLLVETQV